MERRGRGRGRTQPGRLFVAHVSESEEVDGVCIPPYPSLGHRSNLRPDAALATIIARPMYFYPLLPPSTATRSEPHRCPVIILRLFSTLLVFLSF